MRELVECLPEPCPIEPCPVEPCPVEPCLLQSQTTGPHRPKAPRFAPSLRWLATCAAALVLVGCGATPEPAEPAVPEVLDNPALGIALLSLPEGFVLEKNEGDQLSLVPQKGEGRMWITAGETSDFGIDLAEIVAAQGDVYRAQPGGDFSGGNKLVSQLGEAYYARGRFEVDGSLVEEVRVFTVHPRENKLLTLYYRYPSDADPAERLPQVLDLLARIDTPTPATPAADSESPS